jgi:hypothetical protein
MRQLSIHIFWEQNALIGHKRKRTRDKTDRFSTTAWGVESLAIPVMSSGMHSAVMK